jgi:hypothetical protein
VFDNATLEKTRQHASANPRCRANSQVVSKKQLLNVGGSQEAMLAKGGEDGSVAITEARLDLVQLPMTDSVGGAPGRRVREAFGRPRRR